MRSFLIAAFVSSSALAAPLPASALLIRERSPVLEYRWTLAPEAALEPVLAARLRARALADQTKMRASATADAAFARKNKVPVRPYSIIARWTATAETPALLVLAGETYAFTGGAHGNSGTNALIWDRRAGKEVAWRELFADATAAGNIIRVAFCKALGEERARRRDGMSPATPEFSDCPSFNELSVIPFGADLITQVRIVADPYVAGPYAEGSYVVELPLSPEVLRLVKPAYRAAFLRP